MMYVERLILETDDQGFFQQKTKFPPNSKLEVIVLVLEKSSPLKRKPALEIAGKASCLVDLTESIIPEEHWQTLK